MKKRLAVFMVALAFTSAALALGCGAAYQRCKDCGKVVKTTVLRGIHFDFDKYALRADGTAILNEDVELLKKDPSLDVSIDGHCDIIGSDAYNQTLSEKRAKAVYDYFLANGIAADRMKYQGFGRKKPIVPNDTDGNRAMNRRVEINIIKMRP
jgi:OOP family OmpA-OmpF porin